MGQAVKEVLKPESSIELAVVEDGAAFSCVIDQSVQKALQEPEKFSLSEPLRLIGKIYNIDVASRRFKIDVITKKVIVPFTAEQFEVVDALRWNKRAYISGLPEDHRVKALASVVEIREATDEEEDGLIVPSEHFRGERTEAYRATAERLSEIAKLEPNWNSYGAVVVHPATIGYVSSFVRDIAAVLSDYDIELPVPFVAPTPLGGIQLEWAASGRELELEILTPRRFHFLRTADGLEEERMATRWEAMRLIRWLATGDEP
jgi:hypothetical protein